ncbi:uncharacterized protein FOMMEDRAFT_140715 [Fomitiporia mediterranea MF3/22]|uniref:uncharacterized protein n=1 Tax=Fomitiporia mediterranea (strain MF3/22) TaxID=694068 RepID=UPI00044074AD|nr:uncharacterized protein FOMMEDRAFT_140715 [Fomitiporia mediterranea MF3/22]EJD02907.1 hypothetical protein FOMMEDRAFT_140715 [Fomitiporia mediterranea MF3/22]
MRGRSQRANEMKKLPISLLRDSRVDAGDTQGPNNLPLNVTRTQQRKTPKTMGVVIDRSTDEESWDSDEGKGPATAVTRKAQSTPAQRCKQAFGTNSSSLHLHTPSQPVPSRNGAFELPSSLPTAVFHIISRLSGLRSAVV